jgi:hypothetical protein
MHTHLHTNTYTHRQIPVHSMMILLLQLAGARRCREGEAYLARACSPHAPPARTLERVLEPRYERHQLEQLRLLLVLRNTTAGSNTNSPGAAGVRGTRGAGQRGWARSACVRARARGRGWSLGSPGWTPAPDSLSLVDALHAHRAHWQARPAGRTGSGATPAPRLTTNMPTQYLYPLRPQSPPIPIWANRRYAQAGDRWAHPPG